MTGTTLGRRGASLAWRLGWLALALALDGAAFLVAVRLVPGISLQAAHRRLPLATIIALAAGAGVAIGWVVMRLGRPGRERPWRVVATSAAAIAREALVLIALGLLAGRLEVRLAIGTWPDALNSGVVLPLLAGAAIMAVGPLLTGPVARWLGDRLVETGQLLHDERGPIFAIFLLSGAAGLVYEVVWSRELVLVFGNTTQAVSAILTGYFGGLAIGSVVGGRVADRVRRPLRLYGLLELVLVAVVIVTPPLFRGLHEVYRASYTGLEDQPTLLALVRYGLALLALAPATVPMGATLPTLSRYMAHHLSDLGHEFGRLYTVNTVGAIVGTLVSGLVLIELVGLTGALLVGAAGSATAGIVAIGLDRSRARAMSSAATRSAMPSAPSSPTVSSPPPGAAAPPSAEAPRHLLPLVVAFISGLTSLGYQVLWTRLLASGSGNTTYVFTVILAIFLFGLAVGAAVVTRRMGRLGSAVALLGAAQVAIAAIALAGLVILSGQFPNLPFVVRVILVVLPATLVLGVTLPLASTLVGAGEERIGQDAGLLLGVNTFGAICGTFVVPFVLIPTIGSPRSLVVLAALNAVLGLALLVRGRDLTEPARRVLAAAGGLLTLVALAGLLLPNPLVLDPGTTTLMRAGTLLGSAEDEIAAVQAGGTLTRRRLLVGGTGMTSLTVDARLMPLLPLMLRPQAQRALVIAFGMGSAYRSALVAGLTVDGVELVPSVPGMFHWFFDDADQVLRDPRGRLIITDGRNYVELTDQHYDIVVVDPPPPIESSGTSVLYSREFYQAAARRLTDSGVMMEWIPSLQTVDEFRSHVQTFADVFSHVLIAFSPAHVGVYMLGSNSPIALTEPAIRSVLERPGVLADIDGALDAPVSSEDDWVGLLGHLPWIDGPKVRAFAGAAPMIVDDHPLTEYFLLRRLLGSPSPRMSQASLQAATPP
ncbi:MAG: fused MFS/spermidine synthase [Candidatus Limnocylindrales bacterium]